MSSSSVRWEAAGAAGLATALLAWTIASPAYGWVTVGMVALSLGMGAACWWSCHTLYGPPAARIFMALGAALGWFAEQMGSSRGWFFGSYTYTDVLGPSLGNVPLVIPIMWFGLCHIGFLMANLVLWHQPGARGGSWKHVVLASVLSSMIITAFDLGADPYFVYQLKAWIMTEKDGDWFGETVRGFEGWMFVSFVIVTLFQVLARPRLQAAAGTRGRWAALVPILLYLFMLAFQLAFAQPVALKVTAFFAMGIPALIACVACLQWAAAPKATA